MIQKGRPENGRLPWTQGLTRAWASIWRFQARAEVGASAQADLQTALGERTAG